MRLEEVAVYVKITQLIIEGNDNESVHIELETTDFEVPIFGKLHIWPDRAEFFTSFDTDKSISRLEAAKLIQRQSTDSFWIVIWGELIANGQAEGIEMLGPSTNLHEFEESVVHIALTPWEWDVEVSKLVFVDRVRRNTSVGSN